MSLDASLIGLTAAKLMEDLPEGRLKALQCGSPVKLKLIGWIPAPRQLEGSLHAHLREYRLHSEWFEPSVELSHLMAYCYAAENLPIPLAQ